MRALLIAVLVAAGAAAAESAPRADEPQRTFQVPGLAADVDAIAWDRVPSLKSRCVVVFRGRQDISGYNNHANIAFFDGRFFAIWNVGFRDEDAEGQRVVYATSADGAGWTEPKELTGPPPAGRRYTDVGLWQQDGRWFATVSLRDAVDHSKPVRDDACPLLAYAWDEARHAFGPPRVMVENFFSNNVPQRAADGSWLMLGKGTGTQNGVMRSARQAPGAARWTVRDLPGGPRMEELEWYALPDGEIVASGRSFLNTPRGGGRLIQLYSHDNGVSWSPRIVTNFPEGAARHYGMRLSDGSYILLLNPNSHGGRIPLSLARSSDGLIFTRIANVRAEKTAPRYPGRAKNAGYSYPRAIERQGRLYVIYTRNKEDVEVTVVPLAEIEAL